MDRFFDKLKQPADTHQRHSSFEGNGRSHQESIAGQTSEFRQFALQPIVGPNRQPFGSEAMFRAGWEDAFSGDPNITSRIMLDNWLLYGFEELSTGRAVFLNCTRETLMSGFLSLLPKSAVFEILESVKPDDELLSVCRSFKAAGYRFALDDFSSPETMEEFLDLADFIKVDFRHSGRRERACMLRRLNLTRATLIAEKIESEEEFREAVEEGFGLFQGYYFGERISFSKKRDALDVVHCTRILEELQEPGFAVNELAELINLESGIECRLIRRANWATPSNVVVNSIRDALEIVGKADVRNVVTLAMRAASEKAAKFRSIPNQSAKRHKDSLMHWIDAGASSTPWWVYSTSRGSAL
jgi:EAL and modified HD-GYP domain-containing signal transduction protein